MGKGNPNGSMGRKGDKIWREALQLAVKRVEDGDDTRPAIARIAQKTVEMALSGDIQAIKEIGDRLDGKAPLAIDHGGEINHTHEQVKNDADAFTSRFASQLAVQGTGKGTSKPH